MILIGPPEAEKEVLVECFGKVLTGGDSYQVQPMLEHPSQPTESDQLSPVPVENERKHGCH